MSVNKCMFPQTTSTMGIWSRDDEPIIALVAAVFRQAAQDYKYAVSWMRSHASKQCTREFKEKEKLRNDVIRFTKSDLYELVLGGKLEPDTFLKMALKGQVLENKRT